MEVIILGAGVVGTNVVEIFSQRGCNITVIDKDPNRLETISERFEVRTLLGDAISHKTMKLAECDKADLVLSVTSDDAINVLTASLAKSLGAKKVLARVREKDLVEGWEKHYKSLFNIDHILAPELLTAKEVVKRIGTAGFYVQESLSHANITLQEWTISEESPLFLNQALKDIVELGLVRIPCIFRNNEVIIPSGGDRLEPKDRFFMVGHKEDVLAVTEKLESERHKNRVIMIYGGDMIGFSLAKMLERTRLTVKLVDPRESVCKMLSQNLNKTLVLQGSCLEEEFMLQQNVRTVSLFVAVTPDEENNLIASLMAKDLGAKSTLVLSERAEYSGILKRLGVDTAVSTRLIAANALFQLLNPGPLKTLILLQEDKAEALEVTVGENAKICGLSIVKANFPKGLIVAAMIRNGIVIIPKGSQKIHAKDILILFTLKENLEIIQKLFL
jgi:trk system potassium uptake protein TrkA